MGREAARFPGPGKFVWPSTASGQRRQFPVPGHVSGHRAVGHAWNQPVIPNVVDAGREGMDDPDRAPVGDHQDLLVRVEPEHIGEEVVHAGGEILESLGVVCPGALAGEPASMRIGEPFLDLRRGEPFPGPEPPLAQPRIESNLETQLRRDDLRRLPRPGEVARIDDVDVAIELLCERPGLLTAEVVQPRIGAALPAAVAVPVGLAVANEEEGGHAD
jgi:hypothetical protein